MEIRYEAIYRQLRDGGTTSFELEERTYCKYGTLQLVVDIMETYISKSYARRVPYHLLVTNNAKWYLPHHPVLHPRKPNTVKVVFDCAAKHKGISLNDALYQGPVLTNSLVRVLIRFRENPIALVTDIEQMFHQIKVDPMDCDALRFLWWPSGNLTESPLCTKC